MEVLHQHHLLWRAGFGPSLNYPIDIHLSRNEIVQLIFDEANSFTPIKVETTVVDSFKEFKMMSAEDKSAFIKKSQQHILDIAILWLNKMASGKSQLREKMTLFWHDHFASSDKWDTLVLKQNQTLREHALGSFRELLKAMCQDALLLKYLDNPKNKKGNPNENFARELLELFTLGEGNYTEQDIKEAARAFTGHAFQTNGNYIFRPFIHDYDYKTFMGKNGRFDAEDIIDIILEQKQTAKYITTKIYRYFVNDDVINESIINQLTDDFYASDYDISALMKQIFLSDWFYDSNNIGNKIKSPIELIVGLMRQFDVTFNDKKILVVIGKMLGQIPFHPPNVAGWPIGKQWIDSSKLLFRMRLADFLFLGRKMNIPDKELESMEVNKPFENSINTNNSVSYNFSSIKTLLNNKSKEEQLQLLSQFLLQNNSIELNHSLKNWILENGYHSDSIILNFLRLPEYQMC